MQLFGGHPREMSFEELRTRHYELAIQGKEQQAMREAQALISNAEDQMRNALSNLDGAIDYVLNGERQHPNRIDICNAKVAGIGQAQNTNPIQQNPSSFGQASDAAPAFGNPTVPSSLGVSSASTFGKPSALTSTFGQPSAPAFGQSSFGQASLLGRPSTSFGQPSSSTFGQPSAPNPFDRSQQSPATLNQASNPFQRSTTGQGNNPFQPSSAPSQPSGPGHVGPFVQPSAMSSAANPFATKTPVQTNDTAVQNSTPPRNPFALATTMVPPQPSGTMSSPFARTGPTQQNGGTSSAATASSTTPKPSIGRQISSAEMQKDSQGRLRTWNSKPVSYIDDEPCYSGNDGNLQRIWFPDGAPAFVNSAGLPDEAYDDVTKEKYMFLNRTGTFKDGIMPLLPPKREWCNWNL